jgi:preprotein translocase subunit SecF
MKNDYLWDKTGEDKEIEQMENALKAFRYQSAAPPILPVKTLQTKQRQGFNLFPYFGRFAFAGMAGLLIAIVSLGIWFQNLNKQIDLGEGYSPPLVTPIIVDLDKPIVSEKINQPITNKKSVQSTVELPPKTTKITLRQKTRQVQATKTLQLTEEEKFAYNQLMLALSITGAKLKEVKDKANSIDEQTASIQPNK